MRGGIWRWTCGTHVPAGFAFKMASKAEKKRKVGGRGGARAGRVGRAPQSTGAPGATEAQLSVVQEPEPESIKEEFGESLLERRVLRNGGWGELERLLRQGLLCVALGSLKLPRNTKQAWNSTGICLPLPHKPWD